MSDGTTIEWAANADGSPGASWNPIRARARATGKIGWFCVHESEGCRNCYAERLNTQRFGNGVAFKAQNEAGVEIFLDENALTQPLRWRKPRTIFVCSMSDLFGDFVPDETIDRVFAIAALCPRHTFIVLTKRSKRAREWFAERWQGTTEQRFGDFVIPAGGETGRDTQVEIAAEEIARASGLTDPNKPGLWTFDGRCRALQFGWPLPNVWLGVSAEDQKTANARIPDLLATPAALRFVSLEPLLDPIDLSGLPNAHSLGEGHAWLDALWGRTWDSEGDSAPATKLDWVIAGGESGPAARPMHPDWARDLRDQCAGAGVPFFFKQWGEWLPWAFGQPPEMIGQNGKRTDKHALFPDDFDNAPTWNDGLEFEHEEHHAFQRVGKARAGRALDGCEHNARPKLAHEVRR